MAPTVNDHTEGKSKADEVYRKDAAKMVQFIEQENYKDQSQSTFASLLS
jgi:hypothetical protein